MLKDVLKKAYWKLPLSSEFKNKLSAKRYERILAKEAKADARGDTPVFDDAELLKEYAEYVVSSCGKRSEWYREYTEHEARKSDVTLVAYYLTQFHPNHYNDEWWGRGTTEWNNVDQAVPQFVGHYQPRRPGELGYYDLRVDDVMARQVEIAKNYGVGAFCFYYYWFNGKRLLEYPLNKFLNNQSLDMPFFYCWANENWTKRFSGTNADVLMAIEPTVESYQSFIEDVLADFKDCRYYRIDGRPVLSVYRPSMVPDTERVLRYWRKKAQEELGTNLYVIAIQERDTTTDWVAQGYDAESEFQPKQVEHSCKNITKDVRPLRTDFGGNVYDYKDLVENGRYNSSKNRSGKVYPAVMPMWDNTARRNHRGTIFHGSTPDLFRTWLADVISGVVGNPALDDRIVFINAWNEWGEGAYLEPDRFFGYAYLDAVWRALGEENGGAR